jgi:putative ABC transport system ATP-binding protein
MAHPPIIDLEDVHKTYELGEISVRALRGVTLQVQRGEYVAIMGSSGSGKSTLMHILGCLDVPTAGVYRLNGHDMRTTDEDELADLRNREIGFVFQSFNLIPRTRAVANIELPLSYAGLGRAVRRRRALEALRQVGLEDRVEHMPSELSGGQQQRVAIARALVTNPAMILADEPTGNLDPATADRVLSLLAEQVRKHGAACLLVTHSRAAAARADRAATLTPTGIAR